MTPETARLLARALVLSAAAAAALAEVGQDGGPEAVRLAEVYIHEQRIINRIIDAHRDA